MASSSSSSGQSTLRVFSNQVIASWNVLQSQQQWFTENEPITNNWVQKFFGVKELDSVAPQSLFSDLIESIFNDGTIKYNHQNGLMYCSNGKCYMAGLFYAPTLKDILKELDTANALKGYSGIVFVRGQDTSLYVAKDLAWCQMVQAASQCNGLEMINPSVTPNIGIGVYKDDLTQGPAVAISAAPGTFIRNYWVTKRLKAQFNSLYNYGISHINGYVRWGTSPIDANDDGGVHGKITNRDNELAVRVPYMLYTQAVGYNSGRQGYKLHETTKLVHQAYTSSVPINTYGNGGPINEQYEIAFYLLVAQYRSLIAMSILLWTIDHSLGLNPHPFPTIDINLIGTGVFGNPPQLVTAAIRTAMWYYREYQVEYRIHFFPDKAQAVESVFTEGRFDFNTLKESALKDCRELRIGGYLVDMLQEGLPLVYGPLSNQKMMAGFGYQPEEEGRRSRMEAQEKQRLHYKPSNFADRMAGPDVPSDFRQKSPLASRPSSPGVKRRGPRGVFYEPQPPMTRQELVLASGTQSPSGRITYKYYEPEEWQVSMINKIITAPYNVITLPYYVKGTKESSEIKTTLYREMNDGRMAYYYTADSRPGIRNYMIPLNYLIALQNQGYDLTASRGPRGTEYTVTYRDRIISNLVPL